MATTVIEMRTTLATMNASLTPLSSKADYERYLNALYHYKKIFTSFSERIHGETNKAIEKTYRIVSEHGRP